MHNYEQNNGSSNQASLNNILQHTTRPMPHDFALEQGNQPAKRRKSGGTTFVNPPHQSDQAYMQQGTTYHHFVQQPTPYNYFLSNPPVQQISSIQQPMTVTSSRNNTNVVSTTRPQQRSSLGLGFVDALNQRSQSNAISNNNIFNSDKPQAAVLPTSSQVISNQNNHHGSVPSQIVSQQIGFQNQFQQINNNSQQQVTQQQMLQHTNNQGSMQQFTLEMLRYPGLQQQPIHSTILEYDNIPTSNLSTQATQDSIQYIIQRLEVFKVEIENKTYYQSHCEELNNYLQNENVYSSACQEVLFLCLESVKQNSLFGLDIALKVLRSAVNNINRFNNAYQSKIKKLYNDLKSNSRNNVNRVRQQMLMQQQQQMSVPISQPRIDQRPVTDIEKANANWISRIIDRAWGHVMLPYESQMINQHQSSQQEFINSFYVPPEKFERIWKPETPFPPAYVHPNKLPLSYRLISRKPGNLDDDNKCDWPPEEATFKIHINDSEIKLSRKQRIPIKQNQYSFVGVDKPVDIVQYLVAGINRIKITQCMCDPCRQQLCEHILSIEILVKETEEIVLRNARNQTLTMEHGQEIVKRLISGPSSLNQPPTSPASSVGTGQGSVAMLIDDDCDITVNKMKVSLRCPISLLRISEPAKGQNCRHIGCFDLRTYVDVNKKNSKWRCPECNDRLTSETLRIDEYFRNLLRQIPDNVNTVELDSSGKWTVVGQDEGDSGDTTDDDDVMQVDKRTSLPVSSKSDKASNAIIILDDDDEPEHQTQTSNNQLQVGLLQNNNNNVTLPTLSAYSQPVQPIQPIQQTLPVQPSQLVQPSQSNQLSQPVQSVQPQRPKAIRQSSTPGVPYMQHIRPNIQTNDQSAILMQSPPPSANITNITSTTLMQSPPDTTMFVDPIRNNNTRKRKSPQKRKRKMPEAASQEKGNSSTKDNNNNGNDNNDNLSSGRSNNWLNNVMGISPSQQNYHTLLSQDIVSQTATQVASPISPVSITNPNYSHPIQDEMEEGELVTEDEQEEVVLDSSTAAGRNSVWTI